MTLQKSPIQWPHEAANWHRAAPERAEEVAAVISSVVMAMLREAGDTTRCARIQRETVREMPIGLSDRRVALR
jgi:hypothetical protein